MNRIAAIALFASVTLMTAGRATAQVNAIEVIRSIQLQYRQNYFAGRELYFRFRLHVSRHARRSRSGEKCDGEGLWPARFNRPRQTSCADFPSLWQAIFPERGSL